MVVNWNSIESIKIRNAASLVECKSRSICILGMHRSGTSAVARAINLLGVFMGEDSKMMPPSADNPGGFWEHIEINNFQVRLMSRLKQDWDITEPLPVGWQKSNAIHSFKNQLAKLVSRNFDGHALWGWKEPRSCLLLPLWREILAEAQTELSCVFAVRNPVDVANSLMRRDAISFDRALGIWFHYNLVALKESAGLPIVFMSYDRLLANWESEMRRCATGLGLDLPNVDEYRKAMNSFLNESLRNHQSSPDLLRELPCPIRRLYQVLLEASSQPSIYGNEHEETINQLFKDFHAYASLLSAHDRPLTREKLREKTVKKLAKNVDDYISSFNCDDNTLARRLGMAWYASNDSLFQCIQFQSKRPPPKFLHHFLGEKLCRSICKRLAEICCWLHP
jgi:hypothetical protein